ncbi:transcription factor BIM1 isoform X1 [Cucumis sativus]|uniref:BHLH domain-containing protein n=1 Tax=Cucumis sativus TaxID=3659 RepID=A0A0A0LSI8_CUCSA|nr:transcription factor BIM1 isoform X1 [Cucumis sativus]
MELPQPRPFGAEGSKSTHDFLSLYTHSSPQLDPRSTPQGSYLKTHDFLQPQERIRKASTKEETDVERPPPPAPPPSVEHILPGGIGTYSISHVSYFDQRVVLPKPEGSVFTGVRSSSSAERNDENSNCSSFAAAGSGFTLWEESSVKKGKTGKENNVGDRPHEPRASTSQWTASMERPSQSSSNNHHNTFSCLSSSQPTGTKNPTFMEMLKSAKSTSQDEELDDDGDFVIKKETSTANKGGLRIKVDGNSSDQKANTPRSKHSATEQRRRSKINDRFQMLRGLIPHSDQKRDKASFLLEVVEYIQFLQEKVQKYEGSYQEWNHEMAKLVPLRNNQRSADVYNDQSRGINSGSVPALVLAAKFIEKNSPLSPIVPGSAHNAVDSDTSSASTLKAVDHHSGRTSNAVQFPMSIPPKLSASTRDGNVVPQPPKPLSSGMDHSSLRPEIRSCEARCFNSDVAVASEMQKEQDLTIEGGTINISSVYSQGLLNTLTHALQSSGVDLSQARISVQIELGKRASRRAISPASIVKDANDMGMMHARVSGTEDSERATKKLKTTMKN